MDKAVVSLSRQGHGYIGKTRLRITGSTDIHPLTFSKTKAKAKLNKTNKLTAKKPNKRRLLRLFITKTNKLRLKKPKNNMRFNLKKASSMVYFLTQGDIILMFSGVPKAI